MKFRVLKRIFFGLAIGAFLTLIFSPVWGEEGEPSLKPVKPGGVQEAKVKGLSLAEALQKSLENNLSIGQANLNLANAKLDYQKLRASALQSESKIDLKQAELNWDKAQNTFKQTREQIQIGIMSQYIKMRDLEGRLPLNRMSLDLAKRNLDRIREKMKVGASGELDELAARISLQSAKIQLSQSRQDLDEAMENFSFDTGIDNLAQLDLITEFKKFAFDKSLEECLKEALENRVEIQFAQEAIEIADLNLQQLRAENAPLLDIEKAENDLKLSKISLDQERQSIKDEVRQVYYQLGMAEEQISLQADQLGKTKREFENAQAQFKSGLITSDQLSSIEINYRKTYLDHQKAIGDYNVIYQQLLVSLGKDLSLEEKDGSL